MKMRAKPYIIFPTDSPSSSFSLLNLWPSPPSCSSASSLVRCASQSERFVVFGFAAGGVSVWAWTSNDRFVEHSSNGTKRKLSVMKIVKGEELACVDEEEDERSVLFLGLGDLAEKRRIRFELPVVDVVQSERLFAVVLKNHSAVIYVDGNEVPVVVPHAIPLVLGSRWIAYGGIAAKEEMQAGDETPVRKTEDDGGGPLGTSPNVWKDLTKTIAASAFRLGEAGTKRVIDYMQQGNEGLTTTTTVEGSSSLCACDVVVVRDVVSRKTICKIPGVTSFLAFDPSGSLLVSGSAEGQTLQIRSLPHGVLLYRLERGFRPALIVDVCFSPNRKRIAVTSARGTTHLWAINPTGGTPIGILENDNEESKSVTPTTPNYIFEINSNGRHDAIVQDSNSTKISTSTLPVRAVRFLNQSTLRIVSQNGIVEDHRLSELSGVKKKNSSSPIFGSVFSCNVKQKFDICRHDEELDWEYVAAVAAVAAAEKLKPAVARSTNTPMSSSSAVWNFEVTTHRGPLLPTWASPQFEFFEIYGDAVSVEERDSMFFVPTQGMTIQSHYETVAEIVDAMNRPPFEEFMDGE